MFRFRRRYFLWAIALFALEGLIALYAHDRLIRPYAGDVLATIWLYCLGRSLLAARPGRVLLGALLLSYFIEYLQYLHFLNYLGWQHWQLARVVLGSHFAWGDVLAYSLGALVALVMDGKTASANKPLFVRS